MRSLKPIVPAAAVAAAALLLSGCSTPALLPSPPPAAYAQLAGNYLPTALHGVPVQGARISSLRAAKGGQPGQWAACIELPAAQAGFYAIFYDDGAVTDLRQAVAVDGCGRNLAYAPLPAAVSAKAAASAKKSKK